MDAISDPVSIYDAAFGDEEDGMEKISLREGIERLPEREKAVIRLRYYQGKTQTEISKELCMSQAQISRLENSALKLLKSAF